MSKPTPRLKVRDHFACAALPAFLEAGNGWDTAAEYAYAAADAMLRERSGEAKKERDEKRRAKEQQRAEEEQLKEAGWTSSWDDDGSVKRWFAPEGGGGVNHKAAITRLNKSAEPTSTETR